MVNQRQLNGGKQGEGSGLNADKVDSLENGEFDAETLQGNKPGDLSSELGKNVSLNEYRSLENRTAQIDDKLLFELGLMRQGYPDGLLVNFYDDSKIGSTTDVLVNTGINGNIILDGGQQTESSVDLQAVDTTDNSSDITFTAQTDGGFLSVVGIETEIIDGDGGISVSILKNGTEVASDIINNPSDYTFYEFTFTETDYDELFSSGDNIQVLIEGIHFLTYDKTYSDTDDMSNISYGNRTPGYDDSAGTMLEYSTLSFPSSGNVETVVKDLGYQASKVTLTADYSLNGQSIDSIKVFDGADNELASFSEGEIGQTKSISTSRTDYYVEGNLSGDGSDSPEINNIEVGLDNE